MKSHTASTSDKPILLVDTGSLLTLLLSDPDIPGHRDCGLLGLLTDMARQNMVRVVLTDLVLAEFLNSPVPVSKTNLSTMLNQTHGVDKLAGMMQFRSGTVIKEFSKARERIEWLRDMMQTPNFDVISTDCSREYLTEIVQSPIVKHYHPHLAETKLISTDAPDIRELKHWFWDNSKEAQEAVTSIKKLHLREHRGEISVADGLKKLQAQGNVQVLYQGSDVRSRMIQRVNDPKNCKVHDDIRRNPDKKYNPHTKTPEKFDRDTLFALGEGSFLTTLGFLAPLMEQAHRLKSFIHHRDEFSGDDPKTKAMETYQEIADCAAKELGGRRGAYAAWKDVEFKDVVAGQEHESSYHQHNITSPWRDAVSRFRPEQIKEVVVENLGRKSAHHSAMAQVHMTLLNGQHQAGRHISQALGQLAGKSPDLVIGESRMLRGHIEPAPEERSLIGKK